MAGGHLSLTRAGVLDLVRWLAARSRADVFSPTGAELGSFGDHEVHLIVSEAANGFTLTRRSRGSTYSVARSSHLDDLLRFLVVHVVLVPGRHALPEQSAAIRDPELRVRTIGGEVEVRWTSNGEERVLALPEASAADLDLFVRCRDAPAAEIVASKYSANGFPLMGPKS